MCFCFTWPIWFSKINFYTVSLASIQLLKMPSYSFHLTNSLLPFFICTFFILNTDYFVLNRFFHHHQHFYHICLRSWIFRSYNHNFIWPNLYRKWISMLTGLKLSSSACKCVFYRPEGRGDPVELTFEGLQMQE